MRILLWNLDYLHAEVGGQELHATPTTTQGGLPTPAALSEVTQSTKQLLIEQAGECLTQLTRPLGDQENVTHHVARLRMQSNALRSTTDPASASDGGVSNREAGIRNLSQPRGGLDIRVVPIRISTLPPGLASSEPIRSSVSVVYLVLARAQHADSSNVNESHARSAENRPPEALEIPAVNSQEAATLSDQGTLLSNLLHQIMSVVYQHINGKADGSLSVEENQDRGASSSRPYGPSSPPSPKHRKSKGIRRAI